MSQSKVPVAAIRSLIEDALTTYQADALTSNGDGTSEQLEQIRRELRDDLLGLGLFHTRIVGSLGYEHGNFNLVNLKER